MDFKPYTSNKFKTGDKVQVRNDAGNWERKVRTVSGVPGERNDNYAGAPTPRGDYELDWTINEPESNIRAAGTAPRRRAGRKSTPKSDQIPIGVLRERHTRLGAIIRSRGGEACSTDRGQMNLLLPAAKAVRKTIAPAALVPTPGRDRPTAEEYTISGARYAKGQMLVRTRPDGSGTKTRADRLLCALNGRYTNRERGHVLSPSKAKRFEQLFAEGWDANSFTNELRPPKNRGE